MGSSFCLASYNNRTRVPILYKTGMTVYYIDSTTLLLVILSELAILSLSTSAVQSILDDPNLDAVFYDVCLGLKNFTLYLVQPIRSITLPSNNGLSAMTLRKWFRFTEISIPCRFSHCSSPIELSYFYTPCLLSYSLTEVSNVWFLAPQSAESSLAPSRRNIEAREIIIQNISRKIVK